MGIRFRKRVKIIPGVTVNFSKSGVSTTIGAKGCSVNIGKNGVYGNAGIPGTGIYTREKLSGSNSKKGNRQIYKDTNPQVGLFDNVPKEQIEQTSNTEATIGCLSVALCFIAGIYLGIKYNTVWLSIIIIAFPFICIFIYKYLKGNDKETKDDYKLEKTERVHIDTLLKYKSVIENNTLICLLEYKQKGAKSVNVPLGTLDELKKRKSNQKSK